MHSQIAVCGFSFRQGFGVVSSATSRLACSWRIRLSLDTFASKVKSMCIIRRSLNIFASRQPPNGECRHYPYATHTGRKAESCVTLRYLLLAVSYRAS